MRKETEVDNTPGQFPLTQWSAIASARSADPGERRRALDVLVRAYWKPVYKTIRIKWHKSVEDAKDLTQAFFTTAIEKDFFHQYDPNRARFRTFLRTCLRGFVANEEKAARRIKRGGDQRMLSLDFENAEKEIELSHLSEDASLEDYFDREWVRNLFSLAVAELQSQFQANDKSLHFQLFERYDLNPGPGRVSYAGLASEFQLPLSKITNYLAYARGEFRRIVLRKVREITATEQEFKNEVRVLLGIDLK